jgi:hypothetical protein
VVHYHAFTDPDHLALYIQQDKKNELGVVFDIKGDIDSYSFQALQVSMSKSSAAHAGARVRVGHVLSSEINLHDIQASVEEVPVKRRDSHWNCRVWVRQALKKLQDEGRVVLNVDDGEKMITNFLDWEEIEGEIKQQTKDVVLWKEAA